ncbi:MAG: SMP-30/gluconolactonase/LRE family protein [Lachnospiraceae bacterium]|nr:SMP-30/gluconolactonase/LRE family protein [Lachnospiraceae bacterium]
MKEYTAVPFGTERYLLGESTRFDQRTGVLSFVDIIPGKCYLSTDGEHFTSYDFGQMIGALVPAEIPGTYYACLTDGIYLFDTRFGNMSHRLLFDLKEVIEPWQRCNDADRDPMGRLYFGSHVWDDAHESKGNLYCLENGVVRILEKDTKISNGLAWSRDHRRFFFSDTLEKAVFSYDYDEKTGNISGRKVLFPADPERGGLTDGMCIDSQDRLWVAYWGGERIECRSTKDGSLLAEVRVPAQNVTSCCFADKEEKRLFITSSGDGLSGAYDGALFYADLD